MITSNQNSQIKQLRKLHDKKARTSSGHFSAEGEDLIAAAFEHGFQPVALFCTPDAPATFAGRADAELVDPAVLRQASALGSGARVIGIFEQTWSIAEDFELAVYLNAIADPGNVGTILRSALAFCDGPVILGAGCADPFSPKAVRASMGAVFARPPARAELTELTAQKIVLDAGASLELNEVSFETPSVICIGAERAGATHDVVAGADLSVRIAMRPDGPESLNAAIAAGIALQVAGSKLQSDVHKPNAAPAMKDIGTAQEK